MHAAVVQHRGRAHAARVGGCTRASSTSTRRFIYWIDRETTNTTNCDGHVSRSDKSGGSLVTSYTTTACYPQGITSDANNVYWGALDGVYSCPLGGCPTTGPTKMGTAFTTEWIDQDSQFVYWVDNFGAVYRVAK